GCKLAAAAIRALPGTRKAFRADRMATEIEERRIAVDDLKLGMFVCRLDRPWVETPFPLQGFLIHSPEQIRELASYCLHVCIDELRSVDTSPELRAAPSPRPRPQPPAPRQRLGPARPVRYANRASVEDEAPRAREAQTRAEEAAARIIEDVRAGRKLSSEDVDEAVQPIVQSVLRNADAFFWINSLRKRDAYAWSHAVNCSALAAAFGRHMGFPEDVLVELASGGLLLDVGKAELPDALLAQPGPLDDGQRIEMRRYVELSLRIINDAGGASDPVRHMVRTHHERHDGSGYPHGLRENQTPLFGRMAAVV